MVELQREKFEYSHREIANLMRTTVKEVKQLEQSALSKIEVILSELDI